MEPNTSPNVDVSKFLPPDKIQEATLSELKQKCTDYVLLEMLEEGLHADITLTALGGSVKAHRSVLAGASPVFRAMFQHEMREALTSTVEIPDITIAALQLFLLLLYTTDEFVPPENSKELEIMFCSSIDKHFAEFYNAACKYQVGSRLRTVLMPALLRNLSPENCWDFNDCPVQVLGQNGEHFPVCDWYILGNYSEVIKSGSLLAEMKHDPERVQGFMIAAESGVAREAALASCENAKKEFVSTRWVDKTELERMNVSARATPLNFQRFLQLLKRLQPGWRFSRVARRETYDRKWIMRCVVKASSFSVGVGLIWMVREWCVRRGRDSPAAPIALRAGSSVVHEPAGARDSGASKFQRTQELQMRAHEIAVSCRNLVRDIKSSVLESVGDAHPFSRVHRRLSELQMKLPFHS